MAWNHGNSSEMLLNSLAEYIDFWMKSEGYADLLPNEHISIAQQGETQKATVNVVIVTASDPAQSWTYVPESGEDSGVPILEQYHTISMMVKADAKNGGAKACSAVHQVLMQIFANPGETPEREDLIARGIYNVFETNEGLDMTSGADDAEGVFYSQQIDLTCNTDIKLR